MARRRITLEFKQNLKYGENPTDEAALWVRIPRTKDPLSIDKFLQIEGDVPSQTNLTDLDRLTETMRRIGAGYEQNFGPETNLYAAFICKHGNCCGGAAREVPQEASEKQKARLRADILRAAVRGDPRAAFGGSVMVNFDLDGEEARIIGEEGWNEKGKRPYDVVAAPHFTSDAVMELRRTKTAKCRMFENPNLRKVGLSAVAPRERFRNVAGGLIIETVRTHVPNFSQDVLTGAATGYALRGDPRRYLPNRWNLVLAWAIGSSSTSNSISIVTSQRLLAYGVGSTSRIGAVEQATAQLQRYDRSGHAFRLVAYSDGFISDMNVMKRLADHGVTTICVPQGGLQQHKIGQAMQDRVTIVYLPEYARGFYGH